MYDKDAKKIRRGVTMNKRRFWGSIAGAGMVLSCLLTACSGGITTSLPIDMNPAGTVPTTLSGTTGSTRTTAKATTRTTATTGTTTTTKPLPLYDPDPVMTLEEYLSEMRLPEDEKQEYRYIHTTGNAKIIVYDDVRIAHAGGRSVEGLQKGSVYWWDGKSTSEEGFRLLRDCRAAAYATASHMNYTYVAVDGDIYRYKNDGTDEKQIFESDFPIEAMACDSYALIFMTDEGMYRLFRPTGQLDRLCDLGSNPLSLQVYTNDVVLVSTSNGGYFYIVSLNRVVEEKRVMEAYGGRPIVESKSFCRWLYTYCERHPE